MADAPLTIAQATRPYPGEVVCGDLGVVDWHGDACRISLLDGLGHGPEAAAAASAAGHALGSRPDLAPEEALRLCHRELAGTRGAAALIVQIDLAARRVVYAGVGNVEGRLWQPDREQYLVSARGILGAALPRLHPLELPLGSDWLLLLHTDGVSGRFSVRELAEGAGWEAQALADAVLARYGRQTDDATVVVVGPSPR